MKMSTNVNHRSRISRETGLARRACLASRHTRCRATLLIGGRGSVAARVNFMSCREKSAPAIVGFTYVKSVLLPCISTLVCPPPIPIPSLGEKRRASPWARLFWPTHLHDIKLILLPVESTLHEIQLILPNLIYQLHNIR